MYTNIPGVQIIISLLKQNNIKHLVISPGTRNTALVHSVECDDYFKCYSVIDERSAGYFALGLSESLDVPVCVTCTAATATCNYMPAIKEAFERNIQLVALTADQDDYSKFHMGDQNIDQENMFDGYVKCAIDVPKICNENDYWYFNRRVNEALLELNHNGKGPIQINYRMHYTLDEISYFPETEIKKTRKVTRYNINEIDWKDLVKELDNKRILVYCGSDYTTNDILKKEILKFKKKTGAVVLGDYYSNIIDEEVINPSILGDVYGNREYELLKPDLIIFIGTNIYSSMKNNAKIFRENVTTWQISVDGMLNDGFRNVTKLIEGKSEDFFVNINKYVKERKDKPDYDKYWKYANNLITFDNLDFTHLSVIKKFIEVIPANSFIHMSVLDAIRISNYFKMPNTVKCFANIGADGIDGALSTFLGQASNTSELAFLLVGDLSLLYDMNALYQEIPSNIRILIINNYAGSEFHKNFGLERIPTLNKHIAAGHNSNMSHVEMMSDLKYICATNEKELIEGLNVLCNKESGPIILEVFTNADKDAKTLKNVWKVNRETFITDEDRFRRIVRNILGPKFINAIKKLLGRG